jgi:hypothetical protein
LKLLADVGFDVGQSGTNVLHEKMGRSAFT